MADEIGSGIELEKLKLEFERYKAKLDFWKFILVSGLAAVVITAIPPLFQYATAYLEYTKSQAQLRLEQETRKAERLAKNEQFRDGYIKDFLDKALNQDIELRIRFAEYFAFVSSDTFRDGWIQYRDALKTRRDSARKEIDELENHWLRAVQAPSRDVSATEKLLRHLSWAYKEVGYVEKDRSVAADPRAPEPRADLARQAALPDLKISLDPIAEADRPVAQKIVDAFAAAGFAPVQQAAVLAVAIDSSRLKPEFVDRASNGGLFRLSSNAFGGTHPLDELVKADYSINLVLVEAKKSPAFVNTATVEDACEMFVTRVMRPRAPATQVAACRLAARQLLKS
jgi:hypothetical protein